MIGAESIGHIGSHGVLGDLLFVMTGLMFAVFGTLLRHWRVNAFSAATVISVLSLATLIDGSGGAAGDGVHISSDQIAALRTYRDTYGA